MLKILTFSFFTFISLLPNFVFGSDVTINENSNSKVVNFNREAPVIATTAPVITLIGSNAITIEAGLTYTDEGATALDAEDGDISPNIVVSNPVNVNNLGTYTVTYNVQDSDGNAAAPVTRTVHVVDTTKPVITLFGDPAVTLEVFTPYVDAGVQATDSFEGDLRTSLIIVDPVDTTVVGTYVITYNVSDSSGNDANQVERTVEIVDTTPPNITLNGNPVINLAVGAPYNDLAASALDNYDGNITGSINIINPVDNNTVGVYTVRYSVSDAAGNKATEVIRTVNVVDTVRPVISLIGNANVSVEAGTSYVDAGAIAEDTVDGDISPNIVVSNPVNVNSLGDYTITYNVEDNSGNAAIQVSRTVTVADTTKPVITLLGSTTVIQEVYTTYVDAGAEATDSFEGDVTGNIVTVNPVDTTNLGPYVITYNAKDSSGNDADQKVRNVTIVDTTAPIITINGNPVINLAVGTPYTDLGASALDNYDGNITASINTINPVDSNTVGVYTVRYSVSDDAGNIATEVTRTVNVVDTTRPIITLIGDANVSVEAGTSYVDAGAIAEDAEDGNISPNIVVANPVDVNSLGDYTITYNVQDSSGNVATQVTRTVTVVDTSKPVITLIGNSTVTQEVFTPYVDDGAEATDSYEGNITGDIVTVNPVNTTAVGTYVITYNVNDASGNTANQKVRNVNIVDTTAPIITINGNAVITLAVGATYTDLGASALDNYDGNITPSIFTINPVDSNTVGVYTVRYSVSDAAGNIATEVSRTVNVVDTTRPVITLTGDATVSIEAGNSYVDAGATAFDAEDGDISPNIVVSNPVNVNNLGSYTITYNVQDGSGNVATQVIRTVHVVDTAKPVISLVGSSAITIEAGSTYIDTGATALDNVDGDISHSIVVSNPVNVNSLGDYTITYNVQDNSGNAAIQVSRTVTVADTTKPVITLLGNTTITQEVFTPYVDAGAEATDNFEGNITGDIVTVNPVNTTNLGTYVITYNVSDASGNAANQKVRNVSIVDTTAPIITINGNAVINLAVGTPYTDLGASASDNYYGDITGSINTINPVDSNTVGAYTVTYGVSDAAGNIATEVSRTVNVVDTTRPVISLIGDANVSVEAGTSYVDAGAIAEDTVDGDISSKIVVSNPVDVNSLGDYTITYNVQDNSGNAAIQVSRTVTVVDTTPPTITLLGNSTIEHEVFTPYVDDGAEATDSHEGNITGDIVTVNLVNTANLGSHVMTYNVSDASGNAAAEVRRTVNVVDTTPPNITINGNPVINLAVGTPYTDLSASALDNYDGDLTGNINTINPVDINSVGVYTVRYSVSDAAGNIATEVIRTVNVVEAFRPIITLVGDANITLEVGALYVDAGATALDAEDGDISHSIVVSNPVNVNNLGSYTITYDVQDSDGNMALQASRTVTIVDITKPVITLLGNTTITQEVFTPYVDAGAEATDSYEGNITGDIVIVNPVNTTVVGSYIISYNVSDASGNDANQVVRNVTIVDTTAPIITLNGNAVINLAVGTPYTDLGASASDNYDGNITASINTINPVDSNTVGVYTVTYSVSDAAGNIATEVSRTVNVVDTTRPVITLTGDANVSVEAGTSYVDAGAIAEDTVDGDISSKIVVSNPVDVNSLGDYTITYNVQDNSGNAAIQVSRTVTVADTTKPVITLIGNSTIEHEVFTPYVDAGAEATDSHEGNITGDIVTGNPVNTTNLGTYVITYNVSDASGNAASQVERTVKIVDTTAPEITINGNPVITLAVGTPYTDLGASALDNYDGNITGSINTINPVDNNSVGVYTIRYSVSDAAGNIATEVIRTVNIVEAFRPIITLIGDANITLEVGALYVDAGATALDAEDGNISHSIVVSNPVNVNNLGSYTITYDVQDSDGNMALQASRTVTIVDITKPVITLLGNTTIAQEVFTPYVDDGAEATDSFEGNITGDIVTVNPVNTTNLGTYVITYNVSDASGNAANQVIRTVNIIDTTAPIITINGNPVITVEVGTPYTDLGASAFDNYDGNISGSINTVSNVNSNTVGTYTITYRVSDASGNAATQVSRTVNVVDTTGPIITLIGNANVSVEAGTSYVDAGATATDAGDGDLTANITIVNPVNTGTLGVYTITYNVSDSYGNAAIQVSRTVTVVDTTPPTITLLDNNTPLIIPFGGVFTEPGYTTTDNSNDPVTVTVNGSVNTNITGSYTITYTASDSSSNTQTATRTVIVGPQAIAGNDETVCDSEALYLGSNTADSSYSYQWTSAPAIGSADGPVIDNPGSPYTRVVPQATTLFTLTVTTTINGQVLQETDEVLITVIDNPIASVIGNTEICLGESISIGAPAVAGSTYSWTSNPPGFNSVLANPTVSPTQNTIYTLTETKTASSNCTETNSVEINVAIPVEIFAGPSDSICESDTGVGYRLDQATSSILPPNVTFDWSAIGGDGTFDFDNTLNPIYFPGPTDVSNGTVTLQLTGTSVGVCAITPDVSTMVLTITPVPVVDGNSQVKHIGCKGDRSGEIKVEMSDPNYTYLYAWSGPNNYSNTTTSNLIKNLLPGSYTVDVSNPLSSDCVASKTFIVREPAESLQIVTNEIIPSSCTSGVDDGVISITVEGGNSDFHTQLTWSYFEQDSNCYSYSITLKDTDNDGIYDGVDADINNDGIVDSGKVDSNADGIIDAADTDLNGTIDSNFTLSSISYRICDSSLFVNLNLTIGDFTSSGVLQGGICAALNSVRASETLDHDLDSNTALISPVDIQGGTTSCFGEWVEIPSLSGSSYATGLKHGLYSVHVEEIESSTGNSYCSIEEVFELTKNEITYANIEVSDSYCVESSGYIELDVITASKNLLFYYNQTKIPATDITTISESFFTTRYRLNILNPIDGASLEIQDEYGCGVAIDTNYLDISVYDPVFTYTSPEFDRYGTIGEQTNVLFSLDVSNTYERIEWDFGDVSPLQQGNRVSHQYQAEGTYAVTLYAYNASGCFKTSTQELVVGKGYSLLMPNTFTPNNDNINDRIGPVFTGLKELNFLVFNKSGVLIYEESVTDSGSTTTGPTQILGWDGTNSDPNSNFYVYKITAVRLNDEVVTYEGTIFLLK